MSLLIDTDAFCKLASAGLLESVAALFGLTLTDCARLPALPHMLRRGGLHGRLGEALCATLLPQSKRIPAAPAAAPKWLDLLRPYTDIDPGEAHLFALVAERGDFLVTGDKRALRAARNIPDLVGALAGKIAVPEAVLLGLCRLRDDEVVRASIAGAVQLDAMFRVCFSSSEAKPQQALLSYLESTRREVSPIDLWVPAS